MAYRKPDAKYSWRKYLTTEEEIKLSGLEQRAQVLDDERSDVTRQRYLIVARAQQRARNAEGKA